LSFYDCSVIVGKLSASTKFTLEELAIVNTIVDVTILMQFFVKLATVQQAPAMLEAILPFTTIDHIVVGTIEDAESISLPLLICTLELGTIRERLFSLASPLSILELSNVNSIMFKFLEHTMTMEQAVDE
jgi:hypothetical protein